MQLGMVGPADVEWISAGVDAWDASIRWAVGERAPSFPMVWNHVWSGVPVQLAIRSADGTPVGLLQLTDLDLENGLAQLSLLLDRVHADAAAAATRAFLARAFRDFPLRKIMIAVPVDAEATLRVAHAVGRPVARLAEQKRRAADVFVDVQLFEVGRESW